jgi:pimeloyl-ACP methyl ester carboxylesterase
VPERIAVERWGTTGPTLLCLHGLGGSAGFFGPLGPALSGRCRLVAFDFPGSGRSAVPPDVTFDALAAVAVEVARDLAPPCYILGHSMGTIVGLEAIRQSPGLAAGFLSVGGLLQPRADACERIAARISLIEERGMTGLGDAVAAANVSARTRAERPEALARVSAIFEGQPQDGYLATARALIFWTARRLPPLEGVQCLAVTGAEDRYAPPHDVRALAALLPGAPDAVIVPDCAHLPFLEDPLAFRQIVDEFLPPS